MISWMRFMGLALLLAAISILIQTMVPKLISTSLLTGAPPLVVTEETPDGL